jgi:hypothetical protein
MKAEPSAAVYVDLSWAAHVALGEAALDDEELVEVFVLWRQSAELYVSGAEKEPYVEVVVVVVSVVVVLEGWMGQLCCFRLIHRGIGLT